MTVPLSTIKSALKIDYDDDDTDIVRLREAAISLVERRTQLLLSPQTSTQYLAKFEDTMLSAYPYSSLTTVVYANASHVTTTMPSTDYWVDKTQGPIPVLRFLEHPAMKEGHAITVTYEAGYSSVPNELTHAIIALVGGWYNNPESVQPISLQTVPLSVEYILSNISTRSNLR